MGTAEQKNTFPNNILSDKTNGAFVCILAMFVGFLASPAVLSIAMMLYGLNGLRGIHPREWLKNKWWLLGVAWIACYAISYFWSANKPEWNIAVQVKLPFLLLPLAFSYTPRFSVKQMQLLTILTGIILLAGAGYSMSFLVMHSDYYLTQYKYSGVLPTPCRGDHIAFSTGIVLYIIWAVYSWPAVQSRGLRWGIGTITGLLAIFLHVLAAKSGIVCLYLFLVSWSIYLAFIKRKVLGIIVIAAIPLFLLIAVNYIPTFSHRKDYVDFSWYMLKNGDRSGNYGDIGRLMSYKLALHIMKEKPLSGAGAGDILDEMKRGYDQFYPQVADKDRLVPHNQFLIVAVAAGIPAMIIYAIWMFWPLTWLRRNRQSFFFFMTWLVLLVYILIDTSLEVQMGVFIFIFFILQQREELPQFISAKEPLLNKPG